jgi:hypothetical protein
MYMPTLTHLPLYMPDELLVQEALGSFLLISQDHGRRLLKALSYSCYLPFSEAARTKNIQNDLNSFTSRGGVLIINPILRDKFLRL